MASTSNVQAPALSKPTQILLVGVSGILIGFCSGMAYSYFSKGAQKHSTQVPVVLKGSTFAESDREQNNSEQNSQGLKRSGSQTSIGSYHSEILLGEKRRKLLILVRVDLGMTAGKIATQCSHCVVGMFKKLYKRKDANLLPWDQEGGAKVILCVESEAQLLKIQDAARKIEIPTHTVLDGPTKRRTVMAIGPEFGQKLQQFTSGLQVLI